MGYFHELLCRYLGDSQKSKITKQTNIDYHSAEKCFAAIAGPHLEQKYFFAHSSKINLTEKWIPDAESPHTAHGLPPDLKLLFLGPSYRCFCLFKKVFVARWTWSSSLKERY
jgi:hypothetical protein